MADWLYNHRHRSLFRQMHPKKDGGYMSRNQNRGSVVQEGTGSTDQSAGTFSHKVCHLDISQNVENVSYTYPGVQHDSLELFAENGKDKESRTNADLIRLLPAIYKGISIARQIENYGTRKSPQNGNCSL